MPAQVPVLKMADYHVQMVVVVFTVGEMNDMLTVVLSRGTDLAVVASWSGVV
jgi:hypothetical protein